MRQAHEQGPRCTLTGGEWYSAYDDGYIQGPRGLDIDHLVPLAEAWDSGASQWSPAEREAYANDLGDDRALIAVSAASNRSKADQDPTTWLLPAEGYRCQYVADWVADKLRWGLSIDPSEESALSENLRRCSNAPVTVTLAPVEEGKHAPSTNGSQRPVQGMAGPGQDECGHVLHPGRAWHRTPEVMAHLPQGPVQPESNDVNRWRPQPVDRRRERCRVWPGVSSKTAGR